MPSRLENWRDVWWVATNSRFDFNAKQQNNDTNKKRPFKSSYISIMGQSICQHVTQNSFFVESSYVLKTSTMVAGSGVWNTPLLSSITSSGQAPSSQWAVSNQCNERESADPLVYSLADTTTEPLEDADFKSAPVFTWPQALAELGQGCTRAFKSLFFESTWVLTIYVDIASGSRFKAFRSILWLSWGTSRGCSDCNNGTYLLRLLSARAVLTLHGTRSGQPRRRSVLEACVQIRCSGLLRWYVMLPQVGVISIDMYSCSHIYPDGPANDAQESKAEVI